VLHRGQCRCHVDRLEGAEAGLEERSAPASGIGDVDAVEQNRVLRPGGTAHREPTGRAEIESGAVDTIEDRGGLDRFEVRPDVPARGKVARERGLILARDEVVIETLDREPAGSGLFAQRPAGRSEQDRLAFRHAPIAVHAARSHAVR